MADEVDNANDSYQDLNDRNISAIRSRAAMMPDGISGDCDGCGEWYARVVNGLCARCRDSQS